MGTIVCLNQFNITYLKLNQKDHKDLGGVKLKVLLGPHFFNILFQVCKQLARPQISHPMKYFFQWFPDDLKLGNRQIFLQSVI